MISRSCLPFIKRGSRSTGSSSPRDNTRCRGRNVRCVNRSGAVLDAAGPGLHKQLRAEDAAPRPLHDLARPALRSPAARLRANPPGRPLGHHAGIDERVFIGTPCAVVVARISRIYIGSCRTHCRSGGAGVASAARSLAHLFHGRAEQAQACPAHVRRTAVVNVVADSVGPPGLPHLVGALPAGFRAGLPDRLEEAAWAVHFKFEEFDGDGV